MRLGGGGLAAFAVFAVLTTATPAQAQCCWDGTRWVCWTQPLFPDLSLAPDASPYWPWVRNWGGANWRFHGWQPR